MRDSYELAQFFPPHEETCYIVPVMMLLEIGDEANGISGV
jgi:hypothetical protein